MRPYRDRGNPRYKDSPGHEWYCGEWRTVAGAARLRDAQARYRRSDRGRAVAAAANRRLNPQRLFVGRLYLGTVGFSEAEREELLGGASERP